MNTWTLVGVGFNAAIIFMAIVWFIARRKNNAGYGDVGWFFSFAVVVSGFAAWGPGSLSHRLLIGIPVILWSVRGGVYLLVRVVRQGEEDARYRELREQFPKRPWYMFFGFFEFQAVLIGFLSILFALICSNPAPQLNLWEISAAGLWSLAFLGQVIADAQLFAFRSRSETRGRVCDTGLWKYSRHPNYFFEWVIWVAYFLMAIPSPGGWTGFYAPLLMFILLTKVTGVPTAEAQSLKSRGDAYRDYQRRTNAFFPWFPRR